jgi:nicotinate phosphoribosyltransferase
VKIVASSELDEYVIQSIRSEGGVVDIYGVGTKLATCMGLGGGALGGVYKMVRFEDHPKLKVTSDVAKATIPGRKVVYRVVNPEGHFEQDVMCRENETVAPGDTVYDPTNPLRHKKITQKACFENIRRPVMDEGRITTDLPPLEKLADHCQDQLSRLPEGSLRLENPHLYKVSMSRDMLDLQAELMAEYDKDFAR